MIGMRLTTGRNFPYMDVPKIGNKVWIGANSAIIGPVIIEEEVIIAANSLVNKSVSRGAIIAGNPAIIFGCRKDLEYDIFDNPKY
jgi:serine O-acetyltransferase